jgi:plasmid stabilization system protein ParE
MQKCHYSLMARDDLLRMARHIAQTSPMQARKLAAQQRHSCHMLARQPAMGQQNPVLGSRTRVFVHDQYIILFSALASGDVRIERVLQGEAGLASTPIMGG